MSYLLLGADLLLDLVDFGSDLAGAIVGCENKTG